MTREDIIRMAREAGWPGIYSKPLMSITMQEDDFLRFAQDVYAAGVASEREACAKVCDEQQELVGAEMCCVAMNCAAAIRARENT